MTLPANYPDDDDYQYPRVTRVAQTDGSHYLIPWDDVADMVTGPDPNRGHGLGHDEVRDVLIAAFTRLILGDDGYIEAALEIAAERHADETT